ncbi:unnamed protein product [Spirodela intermedia]|uniref:Uncharacterized protein n=1 Tax=Spirodela intermedia TaxID=51605 RepID=A0A7I8J8C7_SPIIN|nr:unnamed protein product [Spirodela intermedia]CAA6666468.1 unnamed protein product [Spirodela intermedia]
MHAFFLSSPQPHIFFVRPPPLLSMSPSPQ